MRLKETTFKEVFQKNDPSEVLIEMKKKQRTFHRNLQRTQRRLKRERRRQGQCDNGASETAQLNPQ